MPGGLENIRLLHLNKDDKCKGQSQCFICFIPQHPSPRELESTFQLEKSQANHTIMTWTRGSIFSGHCLLHQAGNWGRSCFVFKCVCKSVGREQCSYKGRRDRIGEQRKEWKSFCLFHADFFFFHLSWWNLFWHFKIKCSNCYSKHFKKLGQGSDQGIMKMYMIFLSCSVEYYNSTS